VTAVFGGLQGAHTNKEIQALARKTAPLLAAHRDDIGLNEKLFLRVKAVYDARASLKLDREELFLLENAYKGFVRGGALLDAKGKARLREMNQELSLLGVKFGDNVLAETNAFKLVIEDEADLAGLPDSVRTLAAEAAKAAGSRESGSSPSRSQHGSLPPGLREARAPGEAAPGLLHEGRQRQRERHQGHPARDHRPSAGESPPPRLRRPRRVHPRGEHGQECGTGERVPRASLDADAPQDENRAAELQALIDRRGGGYKLASWDWWYAAEKLSRKDTRSTTATSGPTSGWRASATASSPSAASCTA